MNYKKYFFFAALLTIGVASCVDESLFPLPYNSRTVGGYLRMYRFTTNSLDLRDINVNGGANTAFETIFEAVDEAKGENLSKVDIFATFRRGNNITSEVLVKTLTPADFAKVPEPTYSEYKRANVRITMADLLTAFATITTTEANSSPYPSGLTGFVFPGTVAAGDVVNLRWILSLKDGSKWSVLNLQGTNTLEANNTPNITTGQFYSAPSIFNMTIRTVAAAPAVNWTGKYDVQQRAIWSPAHSVFLHQQAFPAYLNEVLVPNQTVTLANTAGMLSAEREFTMQYRGSNVTMRVAFEPISPGLSSAVVSNLVAQFAMTGATTGNLGTVFVPLQSTKVQCSSNREVYWVTPTTGTFAGTTALQPGLPQFTIPNRGVYRTDVSGIQSTAVTASHPVADPITDVFTLSFDDDCDEYGRRNGYCSWTRRVYLTFTVNVN